MVWPIVVAAVLAAAGAASGVAQANQQKQAIKDQKMARRQQTGIQLEENRKNAINTIRESRIKAATIAMSAENSGARGSGAMGALGSIRSQTGASIGFQNMQRQANMNTSQFLNDASRAESKALAWGAAKEHFNQASSFFMGSS